MEVPEKPMIFAFGAYELDTRVYELRSGGTVCPIEPQVFDVLVYLATHRDRVVSKDELLEKLWPDRFVSEATLTSRLKAARRAVGDDGKSQSVIRTLHGRGYRFVADLRESDDAVVRPSAEPSSKLQGAPPPALPDGFVGREAELATLDAALARAAAGRRQLLFVAAEAGAGKTTLVQAFLARATAAGEMLVARGQCVEHRGSGEPFMPILDALGRLCRGEAGGRITALLERSAPSWLVQMPFLLSDGQAAALVERGASGERMLRELVTLVELISSEEPLVVVLEDLHWSDSATLEALDLLARQNEPARLLIIATFRPADVRACLHPAWTICQELRARGQCELLSLPLLATREVDAYLQRRLPGAGFTPELAAHLHARTSGNALFIGNLIDSWLARALIRIEEGAWVLGVSMETLERDVPDTLQLLIEKQAAELDSARRQLLEAASVVGCEFPVALLAALLAMGDEETEMLCEALAHEGRFLAAAGSESWGDGTLTSRFVFTHDLYVDVLYERIPEARRARMHHQAGLVLERTWQGQEKERSSELALHFQRSLDRPRAIRYLELAAKQAIERSAYREAVLHFTSALDLLQQTQASSERDAMELNLRASLAPSLIATRGWADREAEDNYHRALELARSLRDDAALSQVLYGMANMYEFRGEYRRSEAIVRERLRLPGTASDVSAIESHELLACSMMHQGRFREATEHGFRALSAADATPTLRDLTAIALMVQAHGWMSGALLFTGRHDEALTHNETALRLADAKGDELARASALVQAAFVRFYLREPDSCRELAGQGLAIARERRLPFHVACAQLLLGWCASMDGDHANAISEVRCGIESSLAIGARMDMPMFLAILAECQARAGDRDGALETLDEAFARIGRSRSFFYLAELYRMSANLLADRGDRETARAALEHGVAIAEEQESPFFIARIEESMRAMGESKGELKSRRPRK